MEHTHHYSGLTDSQVAESRQKFGENTLTPPQKESLWKLFLEKFKDPIILILLVALLLSIGVACYEFFGEGEPVSVFFEPAGILVAVLLATCVGFWFEYSANKKFEILNQVNEDTAVKVIRNDRITEIPRREVVVGDIVVLETGEEVPADGILRESIALQINESTLTGEPVIHKTSVEEEFEPDATYPSNHILKGTTVVDGHGIMEVIVVGDATEYGKVYQGSQIDNSVKTPLNIQLERLGSLITKASYAIATLIIVGRLFVYFNQLGEAPIDWVNFTGYLLGTAMIAVTLIVVAVPEGLPMSVTLSLALSMKRMLSTNNLVRKMHACETMGACSVICTDKTGTLTENQMRIHETRFYGLGDSQKLDADDFSRLIRESVAVNSTAFLDYTHPDRITALGNPTEGALLLWLKDQNTDYAALREECPVLDQLPFSTERKYMATVIRSPFLNKKILYVKGAPEIVLEVCQNVYAGPHTYKSVPELRETIDQQLLAYQNQAMRTLGFAYKELTNEEGDFFEDGRVRLNDLTFLGIVAISDPVRQDVPAAVRSCLDAGIHVKIVTGDTPGTAKEIGRQIGIWDPQATDRNHLTGPEFAALSDEELLDRVEDLRIMSRARPMDKQRLVKALQEKGEVVAVTGDGTNDAPALKAAQVGLSMGDGTSVAKEASAITILDNSFASITRAVMWGRSLYQNIQRFILFQMTINVVACLIVLIGAFLGTESPLTVTQMLWVNLIMDTFAAMALASLPPSESVMKEKPRRPEAFIITRQMAWRILGIGFFFVLFLFGLLQYFKHYDIHSLLDFSLADYFRSMFDFTPVKNGLKPYELSLFFSIFVLLQLWNMFNAKAFHTGGSALRNLKDSKGFLSIAFVILVGQIFIVTIGGKMFSVVPISTTDWLLLILGTSPVLILGELSRLIFAKRNQ